ncbi:MAG: hypothetical protein ACRDN9_20780, partial [Streptosporangiaceae bacterium]
MYPPPARKPKGPSPLPAIATILALVGALAALVYGGYAVIARRGVFADLADDPSSVSADAASGSDTTNLILMIIAIVLVVVAVALWVVAFLTARRARSSLGLGGFGAVGVGVIAALVGGFMSSGVDDVEDAGKAATAYILVGVGFLLIAIGLLLG